MRWLAILAVVVASALISPTAASGYTFGDWARDHGYAPGDTMPGTVLANWASLAIAPPIDSLDRIGEFDWTTTPTRTLELRSNKLSSVEAGVFSELTDLTSLHLGRNQLSSIESGAFSGLPNLSTLDLISNDALTELNVGQRRFFKPDGV